MSYWPCAFFPLLAAVASFAADVVQFERSTIVGKEGFFRVGRSTDGQWWLMDSDGKPFYYRGVTSINRAGTIGGRRAVPGPYARVIDEKYRWPADKGPFVQSVMQRLREWNFNAMGAWTTDEFFDRGMPYTEIIEFYEVGPYLAEQPADGAVHGGTAHQIPDIFDPQWVSACDEKCKVLCTPRRTSRDLVGYFTDNEIGFGDIERIGAVRRYSTSTTDRAPISILQHCLSAKSDRPAYKVAWDFVLQRHTDMAKLGRDWSVALADRDAVRQLTDQGTAITSPQFLADYRAFLKLFVETYFRTTAELIRKYDANHLLLGIRFGAPGSIEVLEAHRGPWVDVVSANNYRDIMYERIDIYHRHTGKPVLIGEYNWQTDYHSRVRAPFEPDGITPEQRRQYKAELSVTRMFTHPAIVGYTWYRWDDGRNGGLVDLNDEPIARNVELLTKLNPRAESIRLAAAKTATSPIDGRFSITLEDGRRTEGSQTLRVVFGLTAEKGEWLKGVNGLSGEVLKSEPRPEGVKLTVSVTSGRSAIPSAAGKGEYTIELQRRGPNLIGRFEGTFDGHPVQGAAFGFPQ